MVRSGVASTSVRPPFVTFFVMRPGSTRTSLTSPGEIETHASPARGTGIEDGRSSWFGEDGAPPAHFELKERPRPHQDRRVARSSANGGVEPKRGLGSSVALDQGNACGASSKHLAPRSLEDAAHEVIGHAEFHLAPGHDCVDGRSLGSLGGRAAFEKPVIVGERQGPRCPGRLLVVGVGEALKRKPTSERRVRERFTAGLPSGM